MIQTKKIPFVFHLGLKGGSYKMLQDLTQVLHGQDSKNDFSQHTHYLLLPSPSFCSFSRDTSKSGLGGAGGIYRQQIKINYTFSIH